MHVQVLHQKVRNLQGEEEANVHLLQTVWCRYAGQDVSQPTNIWSASLSKLAAAQVLEQHRAKQEQRQQQKQQLPQLSSFSAKLDAHHPAHVIKKHLAQDPLASRTPAFNIHIEAPSPNPAQDVWSRVACIHNTQASVKSAQQNLQASVKSAQQELAELLGSTHHDSSTVYHLGSHTEQLKPPHQQPLDWGPADTPSGLPALQLPADFPPHEATLLPPSPTPAGELSQYLSWNQLDCADKPAHHQQPQSLLPAGDLSSSPMSTVAASSDAWWSQQSSHAPARLDSMHSMHSMPSMPSMPAITQRSDSMTHSTMLGMGQYAMDAAAGPPADFALNQEPPAAPDWLQAVQADTARAVRPRRAIPQDFAAHPSDLPKPMPMPFYSSASHPGREDSGDLSTSVGTQVFLGRVSSSGGQGMPGGGTREGVLPVSMASPKSSLGSSLPSVPLLRAQIAQSNNNRGYGGLQGGQPSPAKLLMQLVAAPSIFSVPLCTGRLLTPPFRVRVAMLSEVPTKLPLTLKAYILSKDSLNSLEQWHPAHHVVNEGVTGGEVHQTVLCNEGGGEQAVGAGVAGLDGEPAGMLGGVTDFVFKDLKFTASSRMKPRWLVIAAVLPTQDVMYVQYNIPTIIMSRSCDQLPKAMAILSGVERSTSGPLPGANKRTRHSNSPNKTAAGACEDLAKHCSPTLQSSSLAQQDADDSLDWPSSGPFTYHRWHLMVERKYNAFNLARPLSSDDLLMMERVAGFHESGREASIVTELTPHQWAFFGVWYLSYLRIFRCHQQLWIMQSPTAICGFGMDRQRAEYLLAHQPVGTFLVRPGLSLAGCMVISAAVAGGACKHMALDSTQLYSRSLEVWVRDVLEAQQVLDYQTGQRYCKLQVFKVHYQRFGVVADGLAK
ncbi:hypothetical protein ABBQ38_004485 [Trebouxia sp. C0009 RCD-2024]